MAQEPTVQETTEDGVPSEPTEAELKKQRDLGYISAFTGAAAIISGSLNEIREVATTGEVSIWTALQIVGGVRAGGMGLGLISASNNGVLVDINLGILTP